jgi:hypothetical protein
MPYVLLQSTPSLLHRCDTCVYFLYQTGTDTGILYPESSSRRILQFYFSVDVTTAKKIYVGGIIFNENSQNTYMGTCVHRYG